MNQPSYDAPPPEVDDTTLPNYTDNQSPNYEETTGPNSTSLTTGEALAAWNARDWPQAAKRLSQLIAFRSNSHNETLPVDLRVILHLIGVAASYNGQYSFAKQLFAGALEQLDSSEADEPMMDELDISVAHWLGDTCFLLREVDNAAFAWSIALSHAQRYTPKLNEQELRLRTSLTLVRESHFPCLLATATTEVTTRRAANVTLFQSMPAPRKMAYLKLTLPDQIDLASPDYTIQPFTKRPQEIRMTAQDLKGPQTREAPWKFQFDRFLLLDPRKFRHISVPGLDVNYIQLDLRFMPNLKGGTAVFPKFPITTVYNTRKHTLKWIVSKLQTGLQARGMLCTQYYDRLKVVRVRDFGMMDYVESFAVVFVRTPGIVVFGLQVPIHLVRLSWKMAYAPAPTARNRVIKEIRAILHDAEVAGDDEGDAYKDVWVSTDSTWRNTWRRPAQ